MDFDYQVRIVYREEYVDLCTALETKQLPSSSMSSQVAEVPVLVLMRLIELVAKNLFNKVIALFSKNLWTKVTRLSADNI